MSKAVTNTIFLKQSCFGFKMTKGKSLSDNLHKFREINLEYWTIEDEDQIVILLNSITRGALCW